MSRWLEGAYQSDMARRPHVGSLCSKGEAKALPQAPPLPLIALVALGTEHNLNLPGLAYVKISDHTNARKLFPAKEADREGKSAAMGVLKQTWFSVQSKCRPAAAALFLSYEEFNGDPQQWTNCCAAVDHVVLAARERKARVCVCVTAPPSSPGSPPPTSLPEDRVLALKRRMGEGEPRYVSLVDLANDSDVRMLGTLLHELSSHYYRDRIARLREKLEALNKEKARNQQAKGKLVREDLRLRVRILVKVGALSEFCQDWRGALQAYQQAYTCIGDLFSASQVTTGSVIEEDVCYLQEARECLSVAEALMAKVGTLLLIQHNWLVKNRPSAESDQKPPSAKGSEEPKSEGTPSLLDAITMFRHHINVFRLPLGRNPSIIKHLEDRYGLDLVENFEAVHWSWVGYQYKKFAKILMEHVSSSLLVRLGAHPSYYQACAAHYAIMRRQSYESSQSRRSTMDQGPGMGGDTSEKASVRARFEANKCKVFPGEWMGQWEIVSEDDAAKGGLRRKMTEMDFLCFLEDGEKSVTHSDAILLHLNSAQTLYEEIGLHRHKLKIQIDLADEYIRMDKVEEAQRILLQVAAVYRKESWESPLADVVLRLRKCAQLMRKTREHVLHSFELCALETVMEEDQRFAIFQSAQAVLMSQATTPSGASALSLLDNATYVFDMHESEALGTCFSCSVGFKVAQGDQVFLGSDVDVLVALKSKAPLPLEIRALRVFLTDPKCAITFASDEGSQHPHGSRVTEVGTDGAASSEQTAIVLSPNHLHKFVFPMTPKQIGHLKCSKVEMLLGDSALLVWDFERAALERTASRKEGPAGISGIREVGSDPLSRMAGVVSNQRGVIVDDLNLGIKVALSLQNLPLCGAYARIRADISTDDLHLEKPALQVSLERTALAREEAAEVEAGDKAREGETSPGIYRVVEGRNERCEGPLVLPTMAPRSRLVQEFLVRCPSEVDSPFLLVARVTSGSLRQPADAAITLNPSPPFNFECALKSSPYEFPLLLGQEQTKAKADEHLGQGVESTATCVPPEDDFLVFASITALCPAEVEVLSIGFVRASESVRLTYPENQCEVPCVLRDQETMGLVCYSRVAPSFALKGHSLGCLGHLVVRWREAGDLGCGDLVGENTFALPTVAVTKPPCKVTCDHPTRTILGVPFPLRLRLRNDTAVMESFEVDMQDEAGFVWQGYRSTTEEVLPWEEGELTWWLTPVQEGRLRLPHLVVRSQRHKVALPVSQAQSIFVQPRASA